jgi:predicted nucleic acid-binding protein
VGDKPRTFVDANIIVRGVTLPRFPYEVLRHGVLSDIRLIFSQQVQEETHRYIITKFPECLQIFERFLSLRKYQLVPNPSKEEVLANVNLVRDLKDVPIALAAIKADAKYLISTDTDLIDIDETTEELRKCITPMSPGKFLNIIMNWSHEQLNQISHRRWDDLTTPPFSINL